MVDYARGSSGSGVKGAITRVASLVVDVDAEYSFEVAPVEDQRQARHSARTVRTKPSAIAFALGARTGVCRMQICSLRMRRARASPVRRTSA